MKNKTNKNDFEHFKKCCNHWIKFWELSEYHVRFEHAKDEDDDVMAWINRDIGGMCVCIVLNTEWGDQKPTKSELDRSAFHEVFHLVLAKLSLLGKARWCAFNEFTREEEAVIRRMENCIFKKLK